MSGKVEEISLVKESFNSGTHTKSHTVETVLTCCLLPCAGQTPMLSNFQDINAITGALKCFLRSLPTPLIHGECYNDLMEQVKSSKNIRIHTLYIEPVL